MKRYLRKLAALIPALLLIFSQGTIIYPIPKALANDPSWITTDSPSLQPLSADVQDQYPVPEPSAGSEQNIDCEYHSYRTTTSSSSLTSTCLVGTGYGYIGNNVLLLNGATLGGPISLYSGGGAVDGVPNSEKALVYHGGVTGADVSFYDDVYSEIDKTVNPSTGAVSYRFKSDVDSSVEDANHNLLEANYGTATFSSNGAWMMYDSPHIGFVRVNLATMQVLPFANSMTPAGSYSQPSANTAISDDGRYAAISYYDGTKSVMTVYDLSTCSTSIPSTITGPVSCSSTDYTSYLQSNISNYFYIQRLRFSSDASILFYAKHNNSGGHYDMKKYRLIEPNASTIASGYLAMGDSYASGEGAGSYVRGTDEHGVNMCHSSTASYPNLMAANLSIASFHTVACSGANYYDVMKDKQYATAPADNSKGSWLPGLSEQISQITNASPGVITLSEGGDDIGFKRIVLTCTLDVGSCYNSQEDRKGLATEINNQFANWVKMYQKIKDAAPGTTVYVTGYPQIIAPTGSCANNVRLTSTERQFAHNLINYLNYVIEQATEKAGVRYVNTQDAFNGHKMCETNSANVAVNGITLGNDIPSFSDGPIGNESYHPDAIGQRLLAGTVLDATDDFTESMPGPNSSVAPPTITDTDAALADFLDVAPAGGTVYNMETLPSGSSNYLTYLNSTWAQTVTGEQFSLVPSTSYNVTLHSSPVSLGGFTTDSSGNLSISASIPNTVDPGYHVVDITGTDMTGQPIDIQRMIFVAASSTDYDGDSIANSSDSCPYTDNAGVDADKNGVDDGCQGYIDIAPLYRAVNGDSGSGQDPTKIYIERNESIATDLGIDDNNPGGADWLVVGATTSSDDATSSITNFTIDDTGIDPVHIYSRYVPYISTRTADNGCVELTPASLAPLTSLSATAMTQVATNTATCRSQPPTADVDADSIPDNQDALYRARNGDAGAGEDSDSIYIERNLTAAETILGISDYVAPSTSWSPVGITNGTTNGTYNKIALLNPTTNTVVSTSGALTSTMWNTLTQAQLRAIIPVVLEDIGGSCYAIKPNSLDLVTSGSIRGVTTVTIPTGMSCS